MAGPSVLPSGGDNQTATLHNTPTVGSTGVPDFSAYRLKGAGEGRTKTMSYFMVGTLGVLTASGAKSAVSDILSNMAASADVLALAKIEVEMGSIPEGELMFSLVMCVERRTSYRGEISKRERRAMLGVDIKLKKRSADIQVKT